MVREKERKRSDTFDETYHSSMRVDIDGQHTLYTQNKHLVFLVSLVFCFMVGRKTVVTSFQELSLRNVPLGTKEELNGDNMVLLY